MAHFSDLFEGHFLIQFSMIIFKSRFSEKNNIILQSWIQLGYHHCDEQMKWTNVTYFQKNRIGYYGIQIKVNSICVNEELQFTSETWKPNENEKVNSMKMQESINTIEENCFPHLDMVMLWLNNRELKFKVYMSPNQQLKSLNKESEHTFCCFNAIPNGGFRRLALLTSNTRQN